MPHITPAGLRAGRRSDKARWHTRQPHAPAPFACTVCVRMTTWPRTSLANAPGPACCGLACPCRPYLQHPPPLPPLAGGPPQAQPPAPHSSAGATTAATTAVAATFCIQPDWGAAQCPTHTRQGPVSPHCAPVSHVVWQSHALGACRKVHPGSRVRATARCRLECKTSEPACQRRSTGRRAGTCLRSLHACQMRTGPSVLPGAAHARLMLTRQT